MEGKFYKQVWCDAVKQWDCFICAGGLHLQTTTWFPDKLSTDPKTTWILIGRCDGSCTAKTINLPKQAEWLVNIHGQKNLSNKDVDELFHAAVIADINYAFAKVVGLDGSKRFYLTTNISEVSGYLKVRQDLGEDNFPFITVLEMQPEEILSLNQNGKFPQLTYKLAMDVLKASQDGVAYTKLIGKD